MRYDRQVGPRARLKFMTDGILMRELQVCVCVLVCVYIMCVYMRVCMCVCVSVCVRMLMFMFTHACVCKRTCANKTNGTLMRDLQADFLLRRYSVLLIDEAHERTLNTDLLLGGLCGWDGAWEGRGGERVMLRPRWVLGKAQAAAAAAWHLPAASQPFAHPHAPARLPGPHAA